MEKNQTENTKKKLTKKNIIIGTTSLVIIGAIIGIGYWYSNKDKIYTDKATIDAPSIDLSASAPGNLKETFVNIGDKVNENTIVAQVGNELIKTKAAGIITNIQKDLGKNFLPGQAVASMLDPDQIRVVGHFDETGGLSDIQIGQQANFTVDAFGSKTFYGTVDEISQVSHQSGVVFNISDKREVMQFDVKIRFNPDTYPELKPGMSAKITIFKK